MESLASELWSVEQSLAENIINIDFSDSKVKYILNPLDYCEDPHLQYLHKYLTGPKTLLFLGLNPGPWGMGQTGVPFGEVTHCQSFLNITGESHHCLIITSPLPLPRCGEDSDQLSSESQDSRLLLHQERGQWREVLEVRPVQMVHCGEVL